MKPLLQIKNGKLLVNGDEYTVQQLQEEEDGTNGLEDRPGGTSKQLGKRDTENCVITGENRGALNTDSTINAGFAISTRSNSKNKTCSSGKIDTPPAKKIRK
nr:unnamed protein product [Callosobruchus analis]